MGGVDEENSVAFSSNNRIIAFCSSPDYTLKMRSTDSGLPINAIGNNGSLIVIAFSVDGKFMASVTEKTIQIWDMLSGKLLQSMEVTDHEPKSRAFSNESKILASCYEGKKDFKSDTAYEVNSVTLWDTESGALGFTLRNTEKDYDRVEALAFSPDDKLLASSSWNGEIKVWDIASRSLVYTDAGLGESEWNYHPRFCFSESGSTFKTNKDSFEIHREERTDIASVSKTERLIAAAQHEEWLQYKQRNTLWLPTEYVPTHVVVHNNRIALGHGSGDVSFIC
ncbi:WD40-repeat-containing domain protein [Aspergillus californicus]